MQTSKRQVNTDYQNEMQREVEKKNNKKKRTERPTAEEHYERVYCTQN